MPHTDLVAPAADAAASAPDLLHDLDRQLSVLICLAPSLPGVTAAALRRRVAPLRARLDDLGGHPFLLVVPGLAAADLLVGAARMGGKAGFTTMERDDLALFRPRPDVLLPDAPAYLLVDPDTGRDFLDVPPEQALPGIVAAGRTPMTLDEGLCWALQDDGLLRSRTCFSMLASRCGDRRVPALWVSKNRPRLGWCWDGAPHTWLGSASAASRIG